MTFKSPLRGIQAARRRYDALYGGVSPCCWLNLSGGDGKVTVTDNAQIQDIFTGDCTLEMMFRYDTQIETFGKLFYKFSAAGFRFELLDNPNLRVFAIFDGTDLNYTTNNVSMSNGSWYHVALVFDGTTKTAQIFVNGTEATYAVNTGGTLDYTSDAGNNLVMGGTTGTVNNLTAGVAWVRISNVKRHTSNFTAPGRCDVPSVDANTVELWAYNEGEGATVAASVLSPTDDGTASGTYSWGCA